MWIRMGTVVVVTLLAANLAVAQNTDPLDGTRISRPSNGPSNFVGQTGGRLTRDNTGPNLRSLRRGGGTGNPVRLPSNDELRRGRPMPPVILPPAFQLGRVGFQPDYGANSNVFRYQEPTTMARLQSVSGLSRSFNRGRPVLDPVRPTVRMPSTPYFATPRPSSTYHNFFNLSPTEAEEVEEELSDPPSLDYADLLKAENDEFRRRKRERALIAFKKGTTRNEELRYQYLTNALDLFAGMRRSASRDDEDEAVFDREIVLLSLHGYMEKGQISSAGRALLELVANEPDFFLHEVDVAQFYGDKESYDRFLRNNRRVGDENSREPIAYGLQAYCQWMQGDNGRAREALSTMLVANRNLANDARIESLGVALQVALK